MNEIWFAAVKLIAFLNANECSFVLLSKIIFIVNSLKNISMFEHD